MVLPSSLPRHNQRHLRLHLRHHIWPHTTHQALPQKDGRGLRRRLGPHYILRFRNDQCPHALQIFHLPCKRTCQHPDSTLKPPPQRLTSHPCNRTSAPTSLPAFPATPTRFSFPPFTPSPSPQPPSPLPLCKCTSSSLPHLHPSSPPLAASSPQASNAHSKSKTLANPSPATAASRTAWIANSSWVCLPLCITRVLLPCIKPMWAT